MTSGKIKASLAPCGLNCQQCFAHVDGEIRRYSRRLKERLGNFAAYALRFETLLDDPIFKKYNEFKEMLDYFAAAHCRGCRNEQCRLFKTCGVRACHQARQIDFCHQCDAFPCDHTNFDDHLYKRWVLLNRKIQRTGVERYYEATAERPRYI